MIIKNLRENNTAFTPDTVLVHRMYSIFIYTTYYRMPLGIDFLPYPPD